MKTVAFNVPCFWLGGSERWVASLCRWLDPSKFKVTQVVVPRRMINHTAAAWLPPTVDLNDSDRFPEADIVLTWGLLDLCQRVAKGRTVVDVQHVPGFNRWVLQVAHEAAKAHLELGVHLAVVGEECLASFPPSIRGSDVTVIPNGADPATVQPVRTHGEVRAGLGIKPWNRLAICVGRVSHDKNTQLFLDAVDQLPPAWRGLTVGPPQSVSDTPDIRYGQKTWSQGPVGGVGDVMSAADVLVHPSEYESHCLVLNEAWLTKLPTVAVAHSTNLRFQRLHGQLSELVPPCSTPAQVADAILRASKWTPAQLEHPYQTAMTHYTAEVMGKRWSEYLDSL